MKYKYSLLRSEDSETSNNTIDGGAVALTESSSIFKGEEKDDDWLKSNKNKETRLLERNENPQHNGELHIPEHDLLPYPYKVFYIIGSEFCERFSFYGLKAVLVLYMSNVLLLGEDSATSFFHGWTFLCYFTAIIGAFLADSFLGKFRTIFYSSFVYLLGNVVLSLASTTPLMPNLIEKIALSAAGLVLIAFGTGGIKPCVSAFGGDQFELPQQEQQLSKFFSVFYFSINAGALFSTFLTPILREDVSCFGGDCFPLAFGVPALLMLIALLLFFVGAPHYKIIPPEGNIAAEVTKCIIYAGCKKIRLVTSRISSSDSSSSLSSDDKTSSHWLHLAADRFPTSLIEDVKALLAVFVLYIPLPIFWALYDQQGSRWTFQAAKLSGSLGHWTIKPDQMQVLNPILIMILIPLFQTVVYPFLSRFHLLTNCLHRMIVGGILASLAFVVSGLLQLAIEDTRLHTLPEGKFSLTVLNAVPCPATIEVSSSHHVEQLQFIPSLDMISNFYDEGSFVDASNNTTHSHASIKLSFTAMYSECSSVMETNSTIQIHIDEKSKEIFLAVTPYLEKIEIIRLPRATQHYNNTSIFRLIDATDFFRLSPIILRMGNDTIEIKSKFYSKGLSSSNTESIPGGSYEVVLPALPDGGTEEVLGTFTTSYATVLFLHTSPSLLKAPKSMKVFNMLDPSIHMLWLIPQYVLISVGEIMFSITGLEFSFRQAPASMKSVVQAAWLLTSAFGDLVVVIVAQSKFFTRQSFEFFLFAALMLADMMVFYCLSRRFDGISTEMKDHIRNNTMYEDIQGQESPFREEIKEQESPFDEDNPDQHSMTLDSSRSESPSPSEQFKHKDSSL